jgi:CMP-N-acetylneuraminic acid synthetase
MFEGKRVLAVVPARGGSKGLPRKNLQPLLGRSLIAHVGECVGAMPLIDRAVVSTDDEAIAAEAEAAGIAAPFRRPVNIAGDRIGDLEILLHALNTIEALDKVEYDVVLMLQPTSPLRRPKDVLLTVQRLVKGGFDAVWSVSPTDLKYHPLKQLLVDPDSGNITLFDEKGRDIIARQQLTEIYHRNGVAYAFTRACLLEYESIYGVKTGAVVIDRPVISIDTKEDLIAAEKIMEDEKTFEK